MNLMNLMKLILKRLHNTICLWLPLMKRCKRLTNGYYLLQNDSRRMFWCKWLRWLTLMTNLCLWKLIWMPKTQSKKLRKMRCLTEDYVLTWIRQCNEYRNIHYLRYKLLSRRPAFYTFRLNTTMKNSCCI